MKNNGRMYLLRAFGTLSTIAGAVKKKIIPSLKCRSIWFGLFTSLMSILKNILVYQSISIKEFDVTPYIIYIELKLEVKYVWFILRKSDVQF